MSTSFFFSFFLQNKDIYWGISRGHGNGELGVALEKPVESRVGYLEPTFYSDISEVSTFIHSIYHQN